MKKHAFVNAIVYIYVFLFTYTGIMKIIDHPPFYTTIHHMQFLAPYASFVSWLIPIGELLIVVALLLKKTKIIGLYSALITMIVFTGYTLYFIKNPTHRPCSCGGIIQKMNWHQHLYFNGTLTILTLLALLLDTNVIRRRSSPKNSLKYTFQ